MRDFVRQPTGTVISRLARAHPFLIMAALAVVVPLVWQLSALKYDDGILGPTLRIVSYILLWPALLLAYGAHFIKAIGNAPWVFMLGWVAVVFAYILLDVVFTLWAKNRASAA